MKRKIYSFAGNWEDVILDNALKDVEKIFYIDVGANDPIVHSVTQWFYYGGGQGINIEPQEKLYKSLCYNRGRDINLCCAVGAEVGNEKLYVNEEHHGNATFREDYVEKENESVGIFEERTVKVNTLDNIWNQYVEEDVHFLKIDVEGYEENVLSGIDLKTHRPWIICVEAVEPGTDKDTSHVWEDKNMNHQPAGS